MKTAHAFPLSRLAVIASGSGTTFEAIGWAVQDGRIAADFVLLVTDRPGAGAIDRAAALGVECLVLDRRSFNPRSEFDPALCAALLEREIGLVLLAGALFKIGPALLQAYDGRILNTHPALLPDDPTERRYGGPGMWGHYVHEAVFAAREKESGATVHLVDGEFDQGKVLRRVTVDISGAKIPEAIAEVVQAAEKPLVVAVLADVLAGRLKLPR